MASLSSTLLARKGQAKPAMRPQGFASFGFGAPQSQEDLGWNDMGHDLTVEHVKREHGLGAAAEPASPQPVAQSADIVPITKAQAEPQPVVAPPAVVRQQEELARDMAPIVRIPRAAAGSKGKAAFTLRLDPERHLRLRLACAITHKSAQMVVTDALDAFLDALPDVTELARTASKSR
jgi:hypothetical protein